MYLTLDFSVEPRLWDLRRQAESFGCDGCLRIGFPLAMFDRSWCQKVLHVLATTSKVTCSACFGTEETKVDCIGVRHKLKSQNLRLKLWVSGPGPELCPQNHG